MDEQINTQIEALPEPTDPQPTVTTNSQSQSPIDDTNALIPSTDPPIAAPSGEAPSKIPIRPQKIRKLSTNDDKASVTDESGTTSSSSVALSTVSTKRRRSASQTSKALPKVIKPLTAEGEIELAVRHLRLVDPLLIPLIDSNPSPHFQDHQGPFLALTKSILYQQLAYKAGTSIYTRFIALCGGEDSVRPDNVLALSSQQLKQIGVSGRKATYLYDLANKYKSGILSDETIVRMDDRSLFTMLSMVKGIGSWSVHMFMIFSLHRPDVLPVSDLGVRKGVRMLYGLDDLPRPSQMEQLCEKWRPYRSVGSWYMWRFVEGKEGPTAGTGIALDGNLVQPMQQIEAPQDGQQQQQHQLQFVEPVNNGIVNLG